MIYMVLTLYFPCYLCFARSELNMRGTRPIWRKSYFKSAALLVELAFLDSVFEAFFSLNNFFFFLKFWLLESFQ